MKDRPLALVVGAGEGLGEALMRRFDDAGYKMVGANILQPLEESDQVDFIWVLRWASLEDRNAAWDEGSSCLATRLHHSLGSTASIAPPSPVIPRPVSDNTSIPCERRNATSRSFVSWI